MEVGGGRGKGDADASPCRKRRGRRGEEDCVVFFILPSLLSLLPVAGVRSVFRQGTRRPRGKKCRGNESAKYFWKERSLSYS